MDSALVGPRGASRAPCLCGRPAAPIWLRELVERGLVMGADDTASLARLTEPHITDALIEDVFGQDLIDEVLSKYLDEGRGQGEASTSGSGEPVASAGGPKVYRLRPQFDNGESDSWLLLSCSQIRLDRWVDVRAALSLWGFSCSARSAFWQQRTRSGSGCGSRRAGPSRWWTRRPGSARAC